MRRSAHVTVAKTAIVLGWCVLFGLVLRAFMPDNPLRLSRSTKDTLVLLVPQGWVFFTRDPREPVERVYRRTAGGYEELTRPNGIPQYAFGLERRSRTFGVETAALITQIPRLAWTSCRGDVAACAAAAEPSRVVIINPARAPMACGDIVITRGKPMPWAWSRGNNVRSPFSIAVATAACR